MEKSLKYKCQILCSGPPHTFSHKRAAFSIDSIDRKAQACKQDDKMIGQIHQIMGLLNKGKQIYPGSYVA